MKSIGWVAIYRVNGRAVSRVYKSEKAARAYNRLRNETNEVQDKRLIFKQVFVSES